MSVIAIIAFAISVLFLGCYSKVSFDEVIGSYTVRYPYGIEELQLNKDSTYIQTVLIDGETTPKTNKGIWKFREKESEVVLNKAMIVDDGFGKLNLRYGEIAPGHWVLGARKSFGRISLRFNPDWDFAFRKIRQ